VFDNSYFGEKVNRLLVLGTLLALALFVFVPIYWLGETGRRTASAQELDLDSLRSGRELYVENCASCHGTRGEGIVGPALNNKVLLEKASDAVLFANIRAGRPNTVMTAWGQEYGGQLTDEDLWHIVSFIRAWEPNAPQVVADEFVPSAARGAAIFAGACFTCHGEDGQGDSAPAINDAAQLSAHDDDWYRQAIVNGRPVQGMPIWGATLSQNQVEDLIALVGAWRAGEQVSPETTVAELLESALFTLGQGDAENALFYLQRAEPIAFGPALEQLDQTVTLLKAGQADQAMTVLSDLSVQWPIGDAELGATIFTDACKGCHGSDGQGGVGQRLKPNQFVQDSSNSEVLSLLLTGRSGTAMRSFDGKLTEEQLAHVIAFLRTWQE
jgi:mono/diheme cytochrome c family protein